MNSRIDNIAVILEADKLFLICRNYLIELMKGLDAELLSFDVARQLRHLAFKIDDVETNYSEYAIPMLFYKGTTNEQIVRISLASEKLSGFYLHSPLINKLSKVRELFDLILLLKQSVSYAATRREDKILHYNKFSEILNYPDLRKVIVHTNTDSSGASVLAAMDAQLAIIQYELRVNNKEIQLLFLKNIEVICARFLLHIGSKNMGAKRFTIKGARELQAAYRSINNGQHTFPDAYLMQKIATVLRILDRVGDNNHEAMALDIQSRYQQTAHAIKMLDNDATIEAHKNGWVLGWFKPVVNTESGHFISCLRNEVAYYLERHNALYFNVSPFNDKIEMDEFKLKA
jgi:hypothetical protein